MISKLAMSISKVLHSILKNPSILKTMILNKPSI